MVEDNGFKLGRSTAATVASASTGRVSPDAQRDTAERNATNDALRQSGHGDVQMPQGQIAGKARPTGMSEMPARTLLNKPSSQEGAPRTTIAQPQTPHVPKGGRPQPVSPEAQEHLLTQGREAANKLAHLQGGHVPKVSPPAPQHPVTPQAAMRNALMASMAPGTKPTAQTKWTDTPAKTATPKGTAQEPATEQAIFAKAKAEEQTGTKQKDAETTLATQVAQQVPSPFAAQQRSETRRADAQKKKIETDSAAEKGLKLLAGGEGAKGVARASDANKEFSPGSYNIAFIEEDDLAALEGNVGPVPGRAVAIDGSSAREVTVLLHFTNKILKTNEDRPPASVLIARTTDDTPFSLRVSGASRADIDRMAIDSRRGIYGGIIG